MADATNGPTVLDRPEVWVNCAASVDGRIAFARGARARLSSDEDLVRVHRLRAQVDGIVVGVGTVVKDDPSLRVRWELVGSPPGRPLTRIVVDGSGRLPPSARVLDGSAPTIVATTRSATRVYPPHVRTIRAGDGRVDLAQTFQELHAVGLRRILVEGGAELLSTVLRGPLFDRLTVYYAPLAIGGATAPPMLAGPETADEAGVVPLELESIARLGPGYVATYRPARPPGTPPPAPAASGADS